MKTTKRLLSILLMLTMLVSMFTVMAFAGDEDAKAKYLEFLQSGTSDYSVNILKKAGVDLESDEAYNVVFDEIKWALNEMSKLI
mgnify:CR=1 FL=1